MTWSSFSVVFLLAFAACEKPNLDATEGGYGGRAMAPASEVQEDTAASPDTASPAAADTATP